MDRHIQVEIQELKERILAMGGYVELAIQEATEALIQRAPGRLIRVHELEQKINKAHIEVDEKCLGLLARQAPVATDLRMVLAIIKINTDLERMGDQATNIAHNTKDYLSQPPLTPFPEIEPMARAMTSMVKDSLDAFMRQDSQLADQVLERDDVVDNYKNEIFRSLATAMKSSPDLVDSALDIILVARNLERLGDHATNIAEDAIFAYTGKDIRHQPRDEKLRKISP
jgi:phosphate transport system protein